jgi:phosphate transport system protein
MPDESERETTMNQEAIPARGTGAVAVPDPDARDGANDETISATIERALAGAQRPAVAQAARGPLDREQREIKDNVLRMGSIVEDQIRAALAALVDHDSEAATAVIIGDARVNEVQRHISSLIAMTIATQQPVARDLRFLLALDHVTYELERIGDHAASVAKQARKLAPEPPLKKYMDLPQMAELAAQQVHGVLRALVDIDLREAREVAVRDDEMDALYHKTFDEVLVLMRADAANVDRGTRVLFAAHYIERIGDRVTNIAEDVVFLATGEIEDLNP